MFDLPPDIPLISACSEAVHAGWHETEQCVLNSGFEFADPTDRLMRVEIDYWTAVRVMNGKALEEAVPKGDVVETTASGATTTTLDSPFLLVSFDNEGARKGEIHRVYENSDGDAAVLLDDQASISLFVFQKDPWSDFSGILAAIAREGGEVSKNDFVSGAKTPFEFIEMSFLQRAFYTVFPSAFPDTTSWDLLQIESTQFEIAFGRPPEFSFCASYDVTRMY